MIRKVLNVLVRALRNPRGVLRSVECWVVRDYFATTPWRLEQQPACWPAADAGFEPACDASLVRAAIERAS